jgi:hypothetical protein
LRFGEWLGGVGENWEINGGNEPSTVDDEEVGEMANVTMELHDSTGNDRISPSSIGEDCS